MCVPKGQDRFAFPSARDLGIKACCDSGELLPPEPLKNTRNSLGLLESPEGCLDAVESARWQAEALFPAPDRIPERLFWKEPWAPD